jgi:hypothetical protein
VRISSGSDPYWEMNGPLTFCPECVCAWRCCVLFFLLLFFWLFVDQDRGGGLPALTTSALARFLRQAYVILMIPILAWRTWTYRAYAPTLGRLVRKQIHRTYAPTLARSPRKHCADNPPSCLVRTQAYTPARACLERKHRADTTALARLPRKHHANNQSSS